MERAEKQYKDSIQSLSSLVEQVVFNEKIHFTNEISNILRKLFKDTRSVTSVFSHLDIKSDVKIINRFLSLPQHNSESVLGVDLFHIVSYKNKATSVTPALHSSEDSIFYPVIYQRDKTSCLPLQVGRCTSLLTLRMKNNHTEIEKNEYFSALEKHNEPIYQDLTLNDWLNNKNFIRFDDISLSRGDIFLEKCERDGGTHVDDISRLSEAYKLLSKDEYPFIEMLICEMALEVLQSQSIFEFFIKNRINK